MLEAKHLTKYYAATAAIRDGSFTVAPGTIPGLLGPNGSGKSTTVSILTALVEPSGGAVYCDGQDIGTRLLEYKARIGYVPEEAHLYMYLTGPEYLSLIGRLRHTDRSPSCAACWRSPRSSRSSGGWWSRRTWTARRVISSR